MFGKYLWQHLQNFPSALLSTFSSAAVSGEIVDEQPPMDCKGDTDDTVTSFSIAGQ